MGIQSILAIPVEEWSLDYIKLKPICIKKEGSCITSSFPDPPESKKAHFELDSTHSTHQFSNASTYIRLDASENMVDMRAKVNSPGTYVFVVHYYQPDHPGKFYKLV